MKRLPSILAALFVALAAWVFYERFSDFALDRRVARQESELERVWSLSEGQGEKLDAHDSEIAVLQRGVKENTERLALLQKEVQAAQAVIRKAEEELEALRQAGADDRDKMARLTDEVALLKKQQDLRRKDLQSLRQYVRGREEDTEERLRVIEERLGVERPTP